uniref:Preprotein translocase SecG subunit n=1 Tax=Nitzschia sp. NIES-3576 TaxID=2083273 RepID=A0A2Z5ZB94_9STRA|nr:Preprotein translocase SecG subunit [Nitzschia sp. NIES-3576]
MLKIFNLSIKIFLIINILIQFPLEKGNQVKIKKQKTLFGSSKMSIYASNIVTVFFIILFLLLNTELGNKK